MSILDPSKPVEALVSEPPRRAYGLPASARMLAWDMHIPATPSAQLKRYLLNKEPFCSQHSDHNLFYQLLPKRLIDRPPSIADKIALSGAGFTGLALAAAILRIPAEKALEMGELKVRRMLVRKRRLWGPLQMDALLRSAMSGEVLAGPDNWNGSVGIFLLRGYRDQVHVATCMQHNGGLWMRNLYPFDSPHEWHNAHLFDIHDARLI